MIDDSNTEENRSWSYFWPVWGAAMLILSLGCVAGDQNVSVGEIGVCGASAEQWSEGRGETGYLGFYHAVNAYEMTTDPGYYEFDPYLLEGSFGSYYVSHWSTGEPVRIVDVRSSDPDVLAVDTIYTDQGLFDIEAIRPGVAEIRVETDAGVADRIEFVVSELDEVAFNHCCSSSSNAFYLTDSEIEIPVTYYDRYGETPIGFGRFPFRISDEDNLTWIPDRADPTDIHLRTGKRARSVTLTPTVAGAPLTLDLISPSDVDGISVHWEPDRFASGLWFVGGVLHRDNTPICAGKYPMRVETLSPSVCQLVTPDNYLVNTLEISGDQTALVEQRNSGDCEVAVQLLDDNGRVVVEQEDSESFGRTSSSSRDEWDD
jgi:hypothetical protein